MPKEKKTQSNKLKEYVREFPDFKTDGKVLFCKVCNKSVSGEKLFVVKQHLGSAKHKELKERSVTKISQQFLGESSAASKDDQFGEDLCEAFIAADIPLYKIQNTKIRHFFEKYTDYKIPSEGTLRTKHTKRLFRSTIEKIKNSIKNRFLWFSIDETTDATGRYVANVIIGILDPEEEVAKQKFLLKSALLDKANHTTIARLFDDSISILGESFNKDSILLFITDAAPYMVKAARAIQTFYPKITHITCLAHGLHRVCEQVRCQYPNVDRLIANIKKIFLKSPARVQIFKNLEPDLALPPQPIITRWGTWLKAARYYATNYEKILNIITALDHEEAASIKISQDLLRNRDLRAELIFIASNYSFLEESITKLETSGLSLSDQIKIVTDAVRAVEEISGEIGNIIKEKLGKVIEKNAGFTALKTISAALTGETIQNATMNYTISETMAFKFAPITSVDVERSFSMYKSVLRSNRQNFLFENLSEMFVIYCNQNFS